MTCSFIMDSSPIDELITKFNTFDVTNGVPAWALLIINDIKVLAEQFKYFNVLDDRIKQLEDLKAVTSNITTALQVENSRLNKVVELFEEKLDDYEQRNRNQCL